MIGKFCVIRTYSAGVHVGRLESHSGTEVRLSGARRIWRWTGAHTLNEIALRGISSNSRVSEPVDEIILTEAIEIIPATHEAEIILSKSQWAR